MATILAALAARSRCANVSIERVSRPDRRIVVPGEIVEDDEGVENRVSLVVDRKSQLELFSAAYRLAGPEPSCRAVGVKTSAGVGDRVKRLLKIVAVNLDGIAF